MSAGQVSLQLENVHAGWLARGTGLATVSPTMNESVQENLEASRDDDMGLLLGIKMKQPMVLYIHFSFM